ncbi:MAG: hypothetical protein IKR66_07130 [Bacteroidales bacterium]|nr:hypothetical protein [Bacteroidales bacterium]
MKRKLSAYTIASNCTDITDCNCGITELYDAYNRYLKEGKKTPEYIWTRMEKLEAKRDKCSLKEHGMKYDDYLSSLDLGKTDENIKFNFRNQLNQFFANTFVGRFIGVTMPKKILLECGIPNLPIVIRPVQLKEKIVKHSLTKDILKNLNTSINAPLLVFKSLTKIGTFNVIIEKQNEEGIICISLHPNKEIDKIEVTEIASIHGRNLDQLINWCESNVLLYGNSEKTKKVLICSQFNSTKSEYLLLLINNANIEKESEGQSNSQEKLQGSYTTNGTFKFAQHLSELYGQGEKLDWLKAKKIAKDFNIETETEIMQACELGVVLEARRIANNGNSLRQQYEEMKDLYERQVTIRPLDTKSKVLQQYSTPCPLSYLLGRFVSKNDRVWNGKILEPSAGNGLLTIAFPPQQVCVNELDEIRVANLKNLGFSSVTNQNASNDLDLAIFPDKSFRGVITNPPFAKLTEKDKIERHGWQINTLDYKMAVLALDKMHNDGKAAVIVGGKLWNAYWKPLNERSSKQVLFGQWKTFLGYLYAQYNVVDVIYIDGDHIYQKQGTTYPIVVILIDGRHEYDESNKPRYVFDPYQDTILTTFDQLFDRLYPFIETKQDNSDDKRKKAKALMLKMKMIKIKL